VTSEPDSAARSTSPDWITRRGGRWLADLPPGYFALVMATGIIADAASQEGLGRLARVLFWAAAAFYVTLGILFLRRAQRYGQRVLQDLTSLPRAPSCLTAVAGTNVLGAGFVSIAGWRGTGLALWVLGAILWSVLFYTVVAAITIRDPKPDLAAGVSGEWLMLVVATESVAVLGALLVPSSSRPDELLFASLAMCLAGILVYAVVITLVCYRWWFWPMTAVEASPPYWITMGALAITTLACTEVYAGTRLVPRLAPLGPFCRGVAVLAWAGASWWIPLLFVVGLWRHLVRQVPLRYDPQYWSAVFPLGMYGVATHRMAAALDLGFLHWIPSAFLGISLLAWALTLIGMVRSIGRRADRGDD
jgi:tellurite resistance protein TehA-like permease